MSVHNNSPDDKTNGLTASQKNRAADLAGRHPFELKLERRAAHSTGEIVFESIDESTGIIPWKVRVIPVKRGPGDYITGYSVVKHHAHEEPSKGFVVEQNELFTTALKTADTAMQKLAA